jgi:hypothetical protein
MIQLSFSPMPLLIDQFWIVQVPMAPGSATPDIAVPGAAAPMVIPALFTGPQFFIALISGILLAFAIQLLLTNLSVAAGISPPVPRGIILIAVAAQRFVKLALALVYGR